MVPQENLSTAGSLIHHGGWWEGQSLDHGLLPSLLSTWSNMHAQRKQFWRTAGLGGLSGEAATTSCLTPVALLHDQMHQKALCSSSSWVLPKVQKGPGMLRHSTQTGEGSLLGIRWCLPGATMILLEFWLKWEQCKGPTSFLKSIWYTLYPKRFLTMLHHWIPSPWAAVSLGKWQVKLSHLVQNCARLQNCCHCPWVLEFTHMPPPPFTRQLAWAPAEALASPAGTGMGRRRSSDILKGTVICFRKGENVICSLYLCYRTHHR